MSAGRLWRDEDAIAPSGKPDSDRSFGGFPDCSLDMKGDGRVSLGCRAKI